MKISVWILRKCKKAIHKFVANLSQVQKRAKRFYIKSDYMFRCAVGILIYNISVHG